MNTNSITILNSSTPCNKKFTLLKDEIHKSPATPIYDASALTLPVETLEEMAAVLRSISDNPSAAIILGYTDKESYRILSQSKITSGEVGVARSKKNFQPSLWALLDYDGGLGFTSYQQWEEAILKIVPTFANFGRIVLPSSSSRVGSASEKFHIYVKCERLEDKEAFHALAVKHPKLIDPQTFFSNALVYEGAPSVCEKISMSPATITVLAGSAASLPRPGATGLLEKLEPFGPVKVDTGKYELTRCPWSDDHTDTIGGAFYREKGSSHEYPLETFKCMHAACQGRSIDDLKAVLGVSVVGNRGIIEPGEVQGFLEDFFIARWGNNYSICQMLPGGDLIRVRENEFRLKMRAYKVRSLDDKLIPLSEYWLSSLDRREYDEVRCDPSMMCGPNVFNLWQGFAVTPAIGDWLLMKTHIQEIIADGNQELSEHLIKWIAYLFQYPHLQHKTAIVLNSTREGTGKSFLTDTICRIIGHRHTFQASQAKDIVGKFNSHLQHTVFVAANEAFFAGNHADSNSLKDFITNGHMKLEAKGYDAYSGVNMNSMIITSNEERVIAASQSARRFTVCEVSEVKTGDAGYFNALADHMMEDGGDEAMLYDMLRMDLSNFNPSAIVKTKALEAQKIASLSPVEDWLYQAAVDGEFQGVIETSKIQSYEGEFMILDEDRPVANTVLYSNFLEYVGNSRAEYSGWTFGKFIRKLRKIKYRGNYLCYPVRKQLLRCTHIPKFKDILDMVK